MKTVDKIENQGQGYDNYKEGDHKFNVRMKQCADLRIKFELYFPFANPHISYAYLIIMDSITLAASSHLSVATSITV